MSAAKDVTAYFGKPLERTYSRYPLFFKRFDPPGFRVHGRLYATVSVTRFLGRGVRGGHANLELGGLAIDVLRHETLERQCTRCIPV
ncbi:hypothetical protein JSE7799_00209 [Jannaschia seosinensis]|uniref:Uncharacterized protein n=1 Tax=Jannaschia seosinensis TaxID=313367 RepID=A0A0M7B5Z5_9RHOB|nr:hypothetical protein JSE7799_00161 [Jannaschia seosinensis]CUH12355.1 hypothetical protein JSE7799_00209 [Jannaschia seosinensis]